MAGAQLTWGWEVPSPLSHSSLGLKLEGHGLPFAESDTSKVLGLAEPRETMMSRGSLLGFMGTIQGVPKIWIGNTSLSSLISQQFRISFTTYVGSRPQQS